MLNVYSNKKIIVTGHTGFKGSWLATWLKLMGSEIYGVSLNPSTKPNHYESLDIDIDSRIIDIRNYSLLEKNIKNINPDFIFHLAAQPLVRKSYNDPIETLETNIIGTANILNISRSLDNLKGVLVITSDKCYDNKEWSWGYREIDPMGGYDPYSASKGAAELIVSCFRKSFYSIDEFGKSHQTLIASSRGGNVIGGGDWSQDRLIPDVIRAISKNETMKIRNPNATRPWQHVLDCLSGYLLLGQKLLEKQKQYAQAWNFGPAYSDCIKVHDIVEKIQKLWPKFKFEVEKDFSAPHEANFLKLDCSKAHSVLNWSPKYNFEKTLSETIEWYRNYYEEKTIITSNQIQSYMELIPETLSFSSILSSSPKISTENKKVLLRTHNE